MDTMNTSRGVPALCHGARISADILMPGLFRNLPNVPWEQSGFRSVDSLRAQAIHQRPEI